MVQPASPAPVTVRRPAVATALAVTAILAIAAFILSFASLTDLAVRSGVPSHLAWLWPLVVDGTIVAATTAIVALAGQGRRRLAYPWSLLLIGAAISVGANATHAVLASAAGSVPAVVAALVASVPPIMLLALTHLSVSLVQRAAAPKPARAARRAPAVIVPQVQEVVPAVAIEPTALAPAPPSAPRAPRVASVAVDPGEVLRLAGEGVSQREIAARLGSSKSSVARVLAKASAEAEPAAA